MESHLAVADAHGAYPVEKGGGEMKACRWGGGGALLLCIDGLVVVFILELFGYVGIIQIVIKLIW